MDIYIDLCYFFWNEKPKNEVKLKYPELSESYTQGWLLKDEHLATYGSLFTEEEYKHQREMVKAFTKELPKGVKWEVTERLRPHHDYATQILSPCASGIGYQCPACKKFSNFGGFCWTGSKFFCPHCGYTIDTRLENERQFTKEVQPDGKIFYVRKKADD